MTRPGKTGGKPTTDREMLDQYLRDVFQSPTYRPPVLPDVAIELLRLTRNPNAHVGQMVKILESDTFIAGKVLHIVQSPLYAGQVPIRSLQQAVVRLGMGTLHSLVMEVAVNVRVFRASLYRNLMEQLRNHSRATAYAMRVTSRYAGLDAEYAFLFGLLHDVGIAGLLIAVSEQQSRGTRPGLSSLWPALELVHEAASGLMAQLWGLPDELGELMRHHHHVLGTGEASTMIAALQISERIVTDLGWGFHAKGLGLPEDMIVDGNDWPEFGAACKLLAINSRVYRAMVAETKEVLDMI